LESSEEGGEKVRNEKEVREKLEMMKKARKEWHDSGFYDEAKRVDGWIQALKWVLEVKE